MRLRVQTRSGRELVSGGLELDDQVRPQPQLCLEQLTKPALAHSKMAGGGSNSAVGHVLPSQAAEAPVWTPPL